MDSLTAQIIIAFTFGLTFVVTLIVLAIKFPHPTPFQYNVFRIVLSLAVAGAAAMIPGFITVELNPTTELLIRAGGALAVFVIVFFFNPAQLAIQNGTGKKVNESDATSSGNSILEPVWDCLDHNLQDVFALAATAARREGKDIISTRTLFAAFRRLHPDPLPAFFSQMPTDALPEPVSNDVDVEPNAIDGIRVLSACVKDSLTNLTPRTTAKDKLASKDVFIDIAKHGKGQSVRRLRTHGVDANRINEILRQLGWSVTERA